VQLTAASGGGGDGLPDVTSEMQSGRCESGPGAEGADSYFSGHFTINDTVVTGVERWTLFANSKWKAKGGRDCTIEWAITGTLSETGACTNCTQGVRFHAVADKSSNCPEELVLGRLLPDGRRVGGEAVDFDNSYAIAHGANNTARVFFAESGNLLGEGYHDATSFNYVSDHQCKWF